jgi:hypothetical protein
MASKEKRSNSLPPRRVVQLRTGPLVVAEVGEQAGLRVESVRPVRVGAGGVEQGHPVAVRGPLPPDAEAALVAAGQEARHRIVGGVATGTALVDGANHQICSGQAIERHPDRHSQGEYRRREELSAAVVASAVSRLQC